LWLADLIFKLLMVLLGFLTQMLKTVSKLYITIMSNRAYFTEPFVSVGWASLRDLTNLFFILVLIAIAIMSILRIQKSAVRSLIPRFVAAVLLVNFSFFICQQIVNFADGLAQAFYAQVSTIDSIVFKWIKPFDLFMTNANTKGGGNTHWSAVEAALTAAVFIGAMLVVFIILAGAMIVRYAIILILVVLSPLAFLAMVLPQTASYAKKFWSNYISMVLWGPTALFFVWLSLLSMNGQSSGSINRVVNGMNQVMFNELKFTMGDALAVFVSCVFLVLAVYSGKVLSSTLSNFTMKAFGMAKNLALGAGGLALGAASGFAGVTGLKSLAKGYAKPFQDWRKARAERLEERGADIARGFKPFGGTAEDRANARKNAMSSDFYLERQNKKAARKRINEQMEEHNKMSRNEVVSAGKDLLNSSTPLNSSQLEKLEAIMRLAAKNGYAGEMPGAEDLASKLQSVGLSENAIRAIGDIAKTSEHGEVPIAAQFQGATAAKADASTIGQEVRSRQGKDKKIPGAVLQDDAVGAYAVAGMTQRVNKDGSDIDLRSEVDPNGLQLLRESANDPSKFHYKLANHIRTEAAAGATTIDVDEGELMNGPGVANQTGKRVQMDAQQASAYLVNLQRLTT
jgi:hypothetical protein